mgnify:CR=1 FL=1
MMVCLTYPRYSKIIHELYLEKIVLERMVAAIERKSRHVYILVKPLIRFIDFPSARATNWGEENSLLQQQFRGATFEYE